MTVSLADLPKGHEFAATTFEMTPEWVAEYRAAVEDQIDAPGDLPPLALAAFSIRALLDQAALPEGAIHVSQEVSFLNRVEPGGTVVSRARVASRGERRGWVLMGMELSIVDEGGKSMMSGRATITFPAGGGAPEAMV
jgi:acyl dehydratase